MLVARRTRAMTIHLPEDLETSVRAEVDRGRFASADEAVAEAVRTYFRAATVPAPDGPAEGQAERKPIWERILERSASIPEEEWAKLPADSSAQHDHYIYGTPKRPTP
jgi:Arc/MetJ-type ribon-helix-helix transcriptional regulator